MGLNKFVSIIAASVLALSLGACTKGKDGAPGAPGAGGKITATMNCSGVITGLTGYNSQLNGLEVKYTAVLSSAGDVYSTASVNDEYQQISGTMFYAAGQAGSSTGEVSIVNDVDDGEDTATWRVSLNRSTLITTVVYSDMSFPADVSLNFTASACTQTYW